MALSETKLAAIAAVNDGWIPVTKALPETGIQVIVTTAPKRGPRPRAINRAWVDAQGKWHGSGTFAQVVAWRQIFPWMGDVKRSDRDAEPDKPDHV